MNRFQGPGGLKRDKCWGIRHYNQENNINNQENNINNRENIISNKENIINNISLLSSPPRKREWVEGVVVNRIEGMKTTTLYCWNTFVIVARVDYVGM